MLPNSSTARARCSGYRIASMGYAKVHFHRRVCCSPHLSTSWRTDSVLETQKPSAAFDVRLITTAQPTLTRMPVIKREESPESPVASIAPAMYSDKPSFSAQAFSRQRAEEAEDAKPTLSSLLPPPPSQPSAVVNLARTAAGAGSLPRKQKYSWMSSRDHRGAVPAAILPAISGARLPSQRGSALATGRVNKTTAAMTTTNIRTTSVSGLNLLTQPVRNTTPQPRTLTQPLTHTGPEPHTKVQQIKMEENGYESGGELGDHSLPTYAQMDLGGMLFISDLSEAIPDRI
jgi:hypothetical protein